MYRTGDAVLVSSKAVFGNDKWVKVQVECCPSIKDFRQKWENSLYSEDPFENYYADLYKIAVRCADGRQCQFNPEKITLADRRYLLQQLTIDDFTFLQTESPHKREERVMRNTLKKSNASSTPARQDTNEDIL